MIRAEHVKQEFEDSKQLVKSIEGKALRKLIEVVAKICLSLRTNQILIMKKLEVVLVKPKRDGITDTKDTSSTTITAENHTGASDDQSKEILDENK